MKRLTTLMAITFALLLITACSDSGGESEGEDTGDAGAGAEITIADFAFSGTSTVSVGDTVEVTNNDSVGHTWTATDGEFDSGTLAEGDSFEHTFEEAGEFDYICEIHPQMTGTITVEG